VEQVQQENLEEEDYWLPQGFSAVNPDDFVSINHRRYYKTIAYQIPNAKPAVFLLIQHKKKGDPSTYYIMRDKVTHEQFRAAMEDPRMQPLIAKYSAAPYNWTVEKDGIKQFVNAIKNEWKQKAHSDPEFPVMYVTPIEAHCFAEWLGGLLPTAKQWDKAGGRFDGAEGPFQPGWTRETGLRRVGTTEADKSLFGCRDMANNGCEWTRDVVYFNDKHVPIVKPSDSDAVVTRGNSFRKKEPYRFPDPNRPSNPSDADYGTPDELISFRVVLELPEKADEAE
jgi:formylglycine-generating enzyme required for sulfatase activity